MQELFSRNIMYWGEDVQNTLKKKHVAIFGLGGVGGYSAEALARAGIGKLTLVDFDDISESNINRQIIALQSTVGQKKTQLFLNRIKDINPNIQINLYEEFYNEEKNNTIFSKNPLGTPDYVIDAIDTQRSKVGLLVYCYQNNIPVFSSMGAGNRVDPTQLFIADISEANQVKCTFVKNITYNLNKFDIKSGITCVFSKERPKKPLNKAFGVIQTDDSEVKKISPSSTPFVPPIAGFYLAFSVFQTIVNNIDKKK